MTDPVEEDDMYLSSLAAGHCADPTDSIGKLLAAWRDDVDADPAPPFIAAAQEWCA